MQSLAVFMGLLSMGYGFFQAGVLGALTGFVACVAIGTGLAIASAESGTGLESRGPVRQAQRIGGLVAAIASALGAFYGEWERGWLWSPLGFLVGVGVTAILGIAMRGGRTAQAAPRSTPKSGAEPLSSVVTADASPADASLHNVMSFREAIQMCLAFELEDKDRSHAGVLGITGEVFTPEILRAMAAELWTFTLASWHCSFAEAFGETDIPASQLNFGEEFRAGLAAAYESKGLVPDLARSRARSEVAAAMPYFNALMNEDSEYLESYGWEDFYASRFARVVLGRDIYPDDVAGHQLLLAIEEFAQISIKGSQEAVAGITSNYRLVA